jgi:hypothetical protein
MARTAKLSLSHVDAAGAVRMVDVGGKPVVEREAVATGMITVAAAARRLVRPAGRRRATRWKSRASPEFRRPSAPPI